MPIRSFPTARLLLLLLCVALGFACFTQCFFLDLQESGLEPARSSADRHNGRLTPEQLAYFLSYLSIQIGAGAILQSLVPKGAVTDAWRMAIFVAATVNFATAAYVLNLLMLFLLFIVG